MSRRGDPFFNQGGFNDPFFGGGQDPFAQMNNMMSSMFNDPFFNGGGFGPSFGGGQMRLPGNQPGYQQQHGYQQQQGYQQQHGYQQQQQQPGGGYGGVTIEEVDDHHAPRHGRRAHQASDTPIVEEPDDPRPHRHSRRTGGAQQQQQQQRPAPPADPMDMMFGGMLGGMMGGMGGGMGGSSVYSYSSSSMSGGGPGGVTYSSSTTHRRGPGGVTETHHQEYDGRTGNETMKVSRGLGDKSRTITRTRDASGQEQAVDNLNNVTPEEASRFDQQWQATAQRALPGAGRTRTSTHGHGNPALPSTNRNGRGSSRYDIREV